MTAPGGRHRVLLHALQARHLAGLFFCAGKCQSGFRGKAAGDNQAKEPIRFSTAARTEPLATKDCATAMSW